MRAWILGKAARLRRLVLSELEANLSKKDQAAYSSPLRAIIYDTAKSQIYIALVELYIYFVQCVSY